MSVEGYFEAAIRNWYNTEKRTKTVTDDMKEILRQFQLQRDFYQEIPADKMKELDRIFTKIRKEVYD